MSERIPQSIAKRVVFRAYLASDGKTPATGKTIAITISKNGGAFGNPAAGATNATAISSGFYYFDLGTGDTGTFGPLAWRGAEGTIDDAGDVYEVSNATNAGFSALPNAAAGAAGGLPVSAGGSLALDTLLGRLDVAVSTRLAGASYTAPLDAAGIRSALGMSTSNLPTEAADALIGRNIAGGSSSGRTVKEALYFLRNKWTIAGGTLTVYGTDDTTSAWTASVTQTAGDPVSASDPS